MTSPDWGPPPEPYAGPPRYEGGRPPVWTAPPGWGPPPQQYPGQQYPGQQYPGQQYPPQQYPGQPYPPQQFPAQPYPPQQFPGQPMPVPQGWGAPPWGAPAWGAPTRVDPAPGRPRRPGTVVAAAVLGYVSAALVLLGTLYGLALSGLLALARQLPLGFGPLMATLQLALIALLVLGATRALGMHRRWLLGALVLQLALTFWWRSALGGVSDLVADGGLRQLPWLFGVLAVVAAALVGSPELARWSARGRDRWHERQGHGRRGQPGP